MTATTLRARGPARLSREAWTVMALIAAGSGLRLILTFATHGLPYDVDSLRLVRGALGAHPLHLYSLVNRQGAFRWPYPPGFLPLVSLASGAAELSGAGFSHLIRLPAIAADAALSWIVWRGLAGRTSPARRVAGAGTVALGPVFVAISGYATQIDSVAILPAVAALLVWERPERQALVAGALIGLAGTIKTVPLLMVLALAPSARSQREVGELLVGAAAVMVLSLAPFLLADLHGVLGIRHYAGSPGLGGLSLVLQPDLAQLWLTRPVRLNGAEQWLFLHHAGLLNGLIVLVLAAYGALRRPSPRVAAAVLWLVVLAFGSGFFFQYMVWALPFLVLAGCVGGAALLQVAVCAPMLLFYVTAWRSPGIVPVYVAIMVLVWGSWLVGAAVLARRFEPA